MPRPVVPSARLALALFFQFVQQRVVRQHDMGVAADLQVLAGDAAAFQVRQFADERGRVQHDAVRDHAERVRVQDSRRDQVQLVLVLAALGVGDDHGMPRVGAAAPAHDDIFVMGQEVNQLALALVPPHRPNDHGVCHNINVL